MYAYIGIYRYYGNICMCIYVRIFTYVYVCVHVCFCKDMPA